MPHLWIMLGLASGATAEIAVQHVVEGDLEFPVPAEEGTAPGDAIIGKWQIIGASERIFIEVGTDSTGYVAWISHMDQPYHPAGSSDGLSGHLKLDRHNPDQQLRGRPVLGITLVTGLRYRDGRWRDGRIYSPDNGKSYRAWARLEGERLRVKGYVKIAFIKVGRSIYLERVAAPPPAAPSYQALAASHQPPDHGEVTGLAEAAGVR